MDEFHHLAVVLAQRRGLGFRDDPGRESLLDAPRQIESGDFARLDALDPDALLEWLRRLGEYERFLQQPQRVARLEAGVGETAQPFARRGRIRDQLRHLACEP